MPTITADAFLEALNLPDRHPYIPSKDDTDTDNIHEAHKDWSIADYFSSASWQSSSDSASTECEDISLSSTTSTWTKFGVDASIDVCNSKNATSSTQLQQQSYVILDFFQEIRPCLISMFHMQFILWAPLVLLYCLKKIYNVKKRDKGIHIPLPKAMCSESPSKQKTTQDEQQKAESYHFFEKVMLWPFSSIFKVVDDNEKENAKTKQEQPQYRRPRSDSTNSTDTYIQSQSSFIWSSEWLAYVVALIMTSFMMTDAMYVLEFGQNNLIALHLFVSLTAYRRLSTKMSIATFFSITTIALIVMINQDLELPTIEPGLYYDESNQFISNTVKEWPVDKRTYDDGRGTPWMLTGDIRTGLPFMVNNIPEQNYVRRYLPLHDDDEHEAMILDVAFPPDMTVRDDARVYLILHGINGSSDEGYVVDFVSREVKKGNIVAVLIARGLGDSQIIGDDILHFARTSDVRAAARTLKAAINQVSPNNPGLLLTGVGYSMGGITLANYVAEGGTDLDAAVAFSAALDTREQVNFHRSASLWQPFIAKAMRDNLLRRFSRQIRQRLDEVQMKKVMRASTLVELDRELFVPYHNFDSLDDYYLKMGAMTDGYDGRISQVSIPLLCVQSLDDPVGYHRTFHDPKKVSQAGSGNTMLLFTRTGGHVGWALGTRPSKEGWSWMSSVAASFAESVDHVRQQDL